MLDSALALNSRWGYFSRRQWLHALVVVLGLHFFVFNQGLVHLAPADHLGYGPLETRVIELVKDPSPERPLPSIAPPKGQPTGSAEVQDHAISAPEASPAATAPTQEIPQTDTGRDLVPTPPMLAASQPVTPSTADVGTNPKGLDHSPIGTPAGAEGETEKVALTLPKQIKVPSNRQWTFVTTHQSPSIYAPNLPTEFRWKVENGQYEVYLGAGAMYAAFTKLSRQSVGRIGDNGLQPQTFTATQRDGTKTMSYFNTADNQVTFGLPGRLPRPLMPGSQDEISTAVQLGVMLAGEPERYRVGDQVVVHVVQRSDAQIWVFKIEADEKVDLPAGPLRAIKLTRAPRVKNDTQVSIWLAPEQQYMPVRLRLDYSSERYDDMKWKGF